MDELKEIIDIIRELPGAALWVLVMLFAYKVIIVGSIFGVIKFAIEKLHDFLTSERGLRKIEIIRQEIHFEDLVNRITISGDDTKAELLIQLRRLRGKNLGIHSDYIHRSSVEWLEAAIDDKLEKERRESDEDDYA